MSSLKALKGWDRFVPSQLALWHRALYLTVDKYPQYNTHSMKVIQITIEPELLRLIDKECGGRNRSSFFRRAAQAWLKQLHIRKLEQKQIQGYVRHSAKPGEFDVWMAEQVWPE